MHANPTVRFQMVQAHSQQKKGQVHKGYFQNKLNLFLLFHENIDGRHNQKQNSYMPPYHPFPSYTPTISMPLSENDEPGALIFSLLLILHPKGPVLL